MPAVACHAHCPLNFSRRTSGLKSWEKWNFYEFCQLRSPWPSSFRLNAWIAHINAACSRSSSPSPSPLPHPLPHALLPLLLRLLASFRRYNRVQAAIELGYVESAWFVEALHEAASPVASARSRMLTLCPLGILGTRARLLLQLSHLSADCGGVQTPLGPLGLLQLLRITVWSKEQRLVRLYIDLYALGGASTYRSV